MYENKINQLMSHVKIKYINCRSFCFCYCSNTPAFVISNICQNVTCGKRSFIRFFFYYPCSQFQTTWYMIMPFVFSYYLWYRRKSGGFVFFDTHRQKKTTLHVKKKSCCIIWCLDEWKLYNVWWSFWYVQNSRHVFCFHYP